MKKSDSDPEAAVTEVFAEYSQYYDLLYADKDYDAEASYVARKLREQRPNIRRVIEFGSGTGRHGRLLAGLGLDVIGIERSPAMLSRSRNAGAGKGSVGVGSFTAVEGDIRARVVRGPFDAAVSLFHVVSYQTGNDDVAALFNNAARHIASGGIFLFDVWYAPAVLTLRPETRIKRVANDQMKITRIAEPRLLTHSNCVEVNYDVFVEESMTGRIRQFQEQHLMRYFTTPEIELLAKDSGFHISEAEEWLTGKPPSTSTWGICYVLQRNAS